MLDEDDIAMLHALGRHASAHRLDDFLAQGVALRVVRPSDPAAWLRARRDDGRIVFSSHGFPDNVVLKACGSRSELRCPSCATLYRGDARHLVRAGLEGGKGVDESIAAHPAVFLTLTAPGFGAVHRESSHGHMSRRERRGAVAHGRPLTCRRPTCPRRRGHRHAAVRPLLRLRRRRAAQCAQRRAVAAHHHLHRPPTGHDPRALTGRVRQGPSPRARQGGRVPAPGTGALPRRAPGRRTRRVGASDRRERPGQGLPRRVRRVEVAHARGGPLGERGRRPGARPRRPRSARVATYVAKYATKEPAMHPGLLGRILSESDLKRRDLPPHLFNMVATAWSLGAVPELRSLGFAVTPTTSATRATSSPSQAVLDHLRCLA